VQQVTVGSVKLHGVEAKSSGAISSLAEAAQNLLEAFAVQRSRSILAHLERDCRWCNCLPAKHTSDHLRSP
jgi:hypothetical protein